MRMRFPRIDGTVSGAFTLVEVLVSSALMAVIVGMILYLTTTVLRSWIQASGELSSNYEARISLDYLARDLEGALFRRDGGVWLISEDRENVDGIQNTVWLRFFTAASDRDREEPGEITAVSYRLLYVNPLNPGSSAGRIAALYRTVIDGRRTFREFLGQLEERAEADFLSADRGAYSAAYLGGNIVSFRVHFYTLDSAAESTGEPVLVETDGPVMFPSENHANPVYVDISLIVLSGDGVELHEAFNTGIDVGMSRDEIVERYGRVFTRQIPFLSEAF